MPEEQIQEAPARPASPAVAAPGGTTPPLDSLIEQYELGDDAPSSPPSVAETPAPVSSPAPAPSVHSRRTLRMAADLGMDQAEIDSHAPDQLDEIVYHLNKQAMQLTAQRAREEAAQRSVQPQATVAGQAAVPPPPANPSPPGEALTLDLDEAQYDPGIIRAFKQMGDYVVKQVARIQQLESHIGTLAQREVAREQMTVAEQIDSAFAEIGDEPTFGKGAGREMDTADLAYQRRIAVLASLKANPPKGGSIKQNVLARAKALFGAVGSQVVPDVRAGSSPTKPTPPKDPSTGRFVSPEQWNAAGLAIPTQRAADGEPPGVPKAEKAVAAFQRENAGTNGVRPESDDDFL